MSFLFLNSVVIDSTILLFSKIAVNILAFAYPFQESHPFMKPARFRPLTMYGHCRIRLHNNSVR